LTGRSRPRKKGVANLGIFEAGNVRDPAIAKLASEPRSVFAAARHIDRDRPRRDIVDACVFDRVVRSVMADPAASPEFAYQLYGVGESSRPLVCWSPATAGWHFVQGFAAANPQEH